MIDGLKPYPEYKDSGVEWLGEVPAHWEVLPNRAVFTEVREREHPDEEMLSVTITRGVLRQRELLADSSKKDTSNLDRSAYKLVIPGDIVYNKMRAWQGAIGVSDHRGIVSPAYVVQRPKPCAAPRYLHFLLRIPAFAKEAERWSYGITSDMWSLRPEHFKLIYSCIPPLPEQTAIVRFLDYADRRLRRVIRARQRLVKLLEEYKQALIQQAVTGQIDVRTGRPYPAYKDSGVEWLGEVPAHWEVRRVKRITQVNPPKSEVPVRERSGSAVFLPMERVTTTGEYDPTELRAISDLWTGFTYFRRGDVIVAKITPCFENGKGAWLGSLPTEYGFGSTEFHVLRPSKQVDGRYLYSVMTLTDFRMLGAEAMTGAAGQQRVPSSFIANFQIPLPPLPEQTAIVDYLDAQTAKLDSAADAARREIELLKEFRTRLIADVVTGKLDVREVAARLPEEPEEPEPPDELEADAETDETTDNLDDIAEEVDA